MASTVRSVDSLCSPAAGAHGADKKFVARIGGGRRDVSVASVKECIPSVFRWIFVSFSLVVVSRAFGFETQSAITVGYLQMANVNPNGSVEAPADATRVYEIVPHFSLRAKTARATTRLDGNYEYFRYLSGSQQNLAQAHGETHIQAVRDLVFVDLRGDLRQRSLDYDPMVEQNRFLLSDSRADVWTLGVSPTAIMRHAESRTDIRYSNDIARVRGTDIGDMNSERFYIATTSDKFSGGETGWQWHGEWRDNSLRTQGLSSHRELGGDYRLGLNAEWIAELSGGMEYTHLPWVSLTQDKILPYVLVGVRVKPVRTGEGGIAVGRRNFGTTYRGNFRYRVRGFAFGMEYNESVVDTAQSLQLVSPLDAEPEAYLRGPHVSRRTTARLDYASSRGQANIAFAMDRRGYAQTGDSDVLRNVTLEGYYRISTLILLTAQYRGDYNTSPTRLVSGTYSGGTFGAAFQFMRRASIGAKVTAYRREYDLLARSASNYIYAIELSVRSD